nr:reverse transcriptase domain-containing protein [Tanacetum cinerariifolium]
MRKPTDEEALSIPWTCEDVDPFTPRIRNFKSSRKTRMPNNVKTFDKIRDPKDHLKIFQAAAQVEHSAMPTWCHMFNSTLIGAARVWFDELPPESIDGNGGHAVHRIYVDRGSSMEVLYEHCFNRLWPEIKSQMVSTTTLLTGFSGETIWPLGQLRLLVTIEDAERYTKVWMNFMIVRSLSPYNGIIGRPRIREIQAVPSTTHGMLKFSVNGEIVTIHSTILMPSECATIVTTPKDSAKKAEACHKNFKMAIHSDFPDQDITIGGTISTKARTKLCTLLKGNLDIFAWQLSDMPGVPRSIAKHRLDIREGYSPVKQKKEAGPGGRQGNPSRGTKTGRGRNSVRSILPRLVIQPGHGEEARWSPINAFPIEELYTPEFSKSLKENTGYWQEPNTYEAVGKHVATSPTKKKKKETRNRQKRSIQTNEALWQNAWTTEEEITLAKGWRAVSENRQHGNARKKDGFWCEVLACIKSQTKYEGRRTYGMGWENRGRPKFQEIQFPNFNQGSEGSSKRYKSSGSSSLNTESRDASINLNTIVVDEDEVQEIRRPGGRDKARAAAENNGSKASGSSTMNDDALARLMVNEMTSAEVQQRKAFMELKRREVERRKR